MGRSFIFLLAAALFFVFPVRAGDDIQGVTAVWRDFVGSLRRGDYPNAHSLFSGQSREAMPYAEFVEEYGPLSVAREMVLAKPESQATDLGDDWAEISYGGVNPGSGRKFKVGVSFVKNDGEWGLVAARNESAERIEAGARSLLRMLWQARDRAPARQLVAAMTEMQGESPILQFYRLESEGATFRAFPLRKGFRTFYLDRLGQVKSVEKSPPPPRRAVPAAIPARSALPTAPMPDEAQPKAAGRRDEMDELSEPPPRRRRAVEDLDDDFPEPAMPRRGAARRPPEVALPDDIR